MTFSKYKRLLFVSLIPLLIMGAVLSAVTSPNKKIYAILCIPWYSTESCGSVDMDHPIYSTRKEVYAPWFDIYPANESKFRRVHVEGSERMLMGATIVEANPFPGYPAEVASYMDKLAGKTAAIRLGINKSSPRSLILDKSAILSCHSLLYKTSTDTYVSRCFGDGWGGPIEYKVSGASKKMLSDLNDSISKEINQVDRDLIIHWSIGIPFFVFVFLLISLIVYLISKAYNYVKKG